MKIEEELQNLNEEQRLAAQTMQNVVVSAGAGSGKTKTLSARYLRLVIQEKLDISSIYALTFTNKAAIEMYERIYRDLQKYSCDPYAKKAIENFHNANIGTLDSFCNSIVRHSSRQYGLSPEFVVNESESRDIAKEVATAFFLKNIKESVIKEILKDEKQGLKEILQSLFIDVLNEYVYISKPLNLAESIRIQKQILKKQFLEVVAKIAEIAQEIGAIEPNPSAKPIKALTESQKIVTKFPRENPSSPFEKDSPAYVSFLSACKELYKVRLSSNIKQEAGKTCIYLLNEAQPLIAQLFNLCNYNVKLMVRTFFLLNKLQKEYIDAKIARNVLNYGDVPNIALDSLKNDLDLRNYYKKKIKAIMIDEFQDNNQLQRDILFLIAEKDERCEKTVPSPDELNPKKLFFVGDEKQSIYAFRGADVSVFKKLSLELQNEIKLTQNYRTESALIDVFNCIFPHIFSLKNINDANIAKNIKVDFEEIQAFKKGNDLISCAEVLYFDSSSLKESSEAKSRQPQDYESYAIAKRIKEMHEGHFQVRDEKTGKTRACKWSDFAILLRTSTKQFTYEYYLKMAGIPYTASTQKYIFKYALLNDFYSIFRLAVYPEDNMAYAQFLKTPFVNISDIGFAQIMMHKAQPFSEEIDGELNKEDLKCFERGREIFNDISLAIKEKTNAQILQRLMYDWGYVYLLLHKKDYQNFLELYDYFFYLATKADNEAKQPFQFVDEIYEYIENEEKLEEMDIPVNQKKDAVKIMTIHKSKGLEFPIVIIPDCGNEGKTYAKDGLVFFDKDNGLFIHSFDEFKHWRKSTEKDKNNFFFERLRDAENQKIRDEAKRLFYVACTRAEVKLILSGIVNAKKEETEQGGDLEIAKREYSDFLQKALDEKIEEKDALSFFALFTFAISSASNANPDFKDVKLNFYEIPLFENLFFEKSKKAKDKSILEHTKVYESLNIKEFRCDEDLLSSTAKETFDGKKSASFNLDQDNEALEIGEITHKFLQATINEQYFDLGRFDLSDEKRDEIELYKNNFLGSSLGQKALNAKLKKTEYGFATMYRDSSENQEMLTLGVIDLFFEYEDVVYIVDYKTDKTQSNRYRRQLSVYKKAVADLYKVKGKTPVIKTYLFYLHLNREVEIEL